jgi:hypothetical protein
MRIWRYWMSEAWMKKLVRARESRVFRSMWETMAATTLQKKV